MAQTLELIPLLEQILALELAKLLVPTPRGKSAGSGIGIIVNQEHTPKHTPEPIPGRNRSQL